MPLITDIQPGKKDPRRVNVYLDGQFAFAVSLEIKILNKLKIGEQVSQKKVEELIFADQTDRLFEKAIKFLSYRPRSQREISNYLLQKLRLSDKGEEEKKSFEKSVESVLKRLEKIGQINDREFTTWWVEQRTKFRKASPRIIKSELFQKGVEKDIIDEVLKENTADPLETAKQAAQKKLSAYKNLNAKEFRLKMSRYLASKGFDWEIIKKVVDSLSRKELE
ncbi:MAG TPA: RecX family transcriptional regulator [Candidatus Nanoarchaeia archaeon]|nr:regulatory protein RecX [uncultured archaeon]